MVSTQLAVEREDYDLHQGEQVELPKVELPVTGLYMGMRGGLIEIFHQNTAEYAALGVACAAAGLPVFHLTYEDDIPSDPNQALTKPCGTLNCPARTLLP